MSALRNIKNLFPFCKGGLGGICIAAILFLSNAHANVSLYGFNEGTPYADKELILNMKVPPKYIINYRDEMRKNINAIARFAKQHNEDFIIVIHEGDELLTRDTWEENLEAYNKTRKEERIDDPFFLLNIKKEKQEIKDFINNVNGVALNNLFCKSRALNPIMAKKSIKPIAIDYCPSEEAFDEAIQESTGQQALFYGFINPNNAFKKISRQPIINENVENILELNDAQNINIFIDDSLYKNKYLMLTDLMNSNYDVIVINPLFHGKEAFTKDEILSIKLKKSGPKRVILAIQNISEIEKSSLYWKKGWKVGSPAWLKRQSLVSQNGFITEYWNDDWKKLMSQFAKSIVDTGYDGTFLTGIQNHYYFENQTPLE